MPIADKVYISAKCSDMFFAEFDGVEHEGYPLNLPGVSKGDDYVELEIDNATGTIVGWQPLTVRKWISIVEEGA